MDTLKLYGVPGSGKTTSGLEWLGDRFGDGVDPWHAAFVSYTRAAVSGAIAKIGTRFDLEPHDLPNCKTIHALCYRELRAGEGAGIADKKLHEFGKEYGFDLKHSGGRSSEDEDADAMAVHSGQDGNLLNVWNFARNRLCFDGEAALRVFQDYSPDDAMTVHRDRFLYFVDSYERWKKDTGLRDFTDLLWEYSETGEPINVTCVVQDEIQDHTPLMHKAADRLFANATYSALLGDDDQAILNFSGATPQLMNRRGAHEVRHLEHSWRCPRRVTDLAQSIIRYNLDREPKTIKPREGDAGTVARINRITEVNLLEGGSWGVLSRNWHLLDDIAKECEGMGVPYHYGGWRYSPWSDRGPLRAVKALRRLRETGTTTLGELQIVASKSGVETKKEEGVWAWGSKKKLKQMASESPHEKVRFADLPELGMTEYGIRRFLKDYMHVLTTGITDRDLAAFNAAIRQGTMDAPPITLSSIHGWKGLEFDNVICLNACGRNAYMAGSHEWRREEERRIAYVAVTRAKQAYYSLYVPGGKNVYPWPWADV